MTNDDLERAYKHTSRHHVEPMASELCGCFYCLATFPLTAVTYWLNEGDGTALCPKCPIDSVIGGLSGFPITDEFLKAMQRRWFNA